MIHVYWVAFDESTCARCRWDERFVDDIICGVNKRAAFHPEVVHHDSVEDFEQSTERHAVVVYPAGAHGPDDHRRLVAGLARFEHVILFLVADEASTFPVELLDACESQLSLWVMTPRPEITYPIGTTFIGDGDAGLAETYRQPLDNIKPQPWCFIGQVNHERRRQCLDQLRALRTDGDLFATLGFTQGLDRSTYLRRMAAAKVVPCPSGIQSQDSFRAFEALTLGCVPILDGLRPDGAGWGYWKMLGLHGEIPVIDDWRELRSTLTSVLEDWPRSAVRAHHWWHRTRHELADRFAFQVASLTDAFPADGLTVLVPTSPIRSHPDTRIINETLTSIRQITDAPISVMVDGVRLEQADMARDYEEYKRRLMLLCERIGNCTPFVFDEWLHQAQLTKRTIEAGGAGSPYLLFVEHDTPLEGPLFLSDVIAEMERDQLNVMRFHHETHVLDDHKHLFLETEPPEGRRYVRTMQWSQRPHLARTQWYADQLHRYFGGNARTMIEDTMHGVVDHAWRLRRVNGWEEWRIGLYAPGGSMKRSGHLDGRGAEPKFDMYWEYDDEVPEGAPTPTLRRDEWVG